MRVVIADLPIDERPRERLARSGPQSLSDAELLALLISPGTRGRSSIDLAREVLAEGLQAFGRREWTPGKPSAGSGVGSQPNLGEARVARIAAALELGRRIASLESGQSEPVRDPQSLAPHLIARYAHHVQERLGAIYLDSRNRIVREREVYVGTLTSATVSTRDVVRYALEDHAASIIIFHNHPSGDPSPSPDDIVFTRKLIEAAHIFNIEILDHLIIGSNRVLSLKGRGVM